MKNLHFFILTLFVSSLSYSQYWSDFEDGTLQGWTNIDTSIILLTNEITGLPYPGDQIMLQKVCDGSSGPIGEMAIINNSENWTGSYPGGPLDAFTSLSLYMKNDNDFDLYLRIGYRGGIDNTKIITTDSYLIPALSDWTSVEIYILNGFTIIEGENSVEEVFADSHEVRIIHNDEISYDGKYVNGVLNISWMSSMFLLSNEDQTLSKATLYPNPVIDIINLKLPFENQGIVEFYNVLGEKVISKEFNSISTQIDLSELNSGIYITNIKTKKATISKKIIKL